MKTQILGNTPRDSDSAYNSILNKPPGDTDALGPWTTLGAVMTEVRLSQVLLLPRSVILRLQTEKNVCFLKCIDHSLLKKERWLRKAKKHNLIKSRDCPK